MANLAIKGHATRGNEVIELLEMLGGMNDKKYSGNLINWIYFINVYDYIETSNSLQHIDYKQFTLEEFLEKFPYKVGDKVSSKYLKNYKIEKMEWEVPNNRVIYKLQGVGWYSANELKPYKEEIMEESIDKTNKVIFESNAQSCDIMNDIIKEEATENGIIYDEIDFNRCPAADKVLLILGNNYEIKEENGNYYAVRKKPQYPKTYVGCCEILYPNENFQTVSQPIKGHNGKKLFNLQKLLICRDAYWKIAGDWKPNWEDDTAKYNIFAYKNHISVDVSKHANKILVFPTKEMRDAFKENFDKDIEFCKELL